MGRRGGMSWALDRDQAEWFEGRNSERGTHRLSWEATIRKPNVLAVFDDPEHEIDSSGARLARPTQQAKEDQPGSDPPLPVEKLIPQVSSDSSGAPG